jgi:uncharacterized protein YdaU (DUF1376 family)
MHYYPHHIGDYKSATTHLSNEEDLAYRRLLEMYYDSEKQIPLDTQWVARRLRVGTEALQSVLNDFFVQTETGWKKEKCDLVIREYHEMAEKNRRNGKLGGRPKTNKQAVENPVGSQSDASGIPVETHSKANQEPITKNNNQGEAALQPTRPAKKVTLTTYMANCKAAGTKPIPDDHYVRDYAKDAGIADEMLQVNWESFKARYLAEKKLYSDWPKVFATSVKERWFKLWFPGDDGLAAWTSTGMQEKQVLEKRMKEAK